MTRVVLALLIFLLLGPVPGTAYDRAAFSHDPRITVTHVVGGPGEPLRGARYGALTLVDGWQFSSGHRRFGGFSAMVRLRGDQLLLGSDAGTLLTVVAPPGEWPAVQRMFFAGALTRTRVDKSANDIEALARDPVSGRIWAALELTRTIWRLDPAAETAERTASPAAIARWPANAGTEAIVRLDDGRFILFSEAADDDARGTEVIRFAADPTARPDAAIRFYYDAEGKGRVTDAALLPDGRILLLHRKLGLWPRWTTTLAIIDDRQFGPGHVWRSRELAVIDAQDTSENYEAMVAEPAGSGQYDLWLASDDNFNSWQRTLLMRFTLDLPPG